MFSALKKLTKSNDDRCPAPMPMSSSLQKKFSRGVHFNMKILIKGDRNVGKSCLLQRLQGGPFIEDYVPTDQIQVAPIHWTYKNTDYIVKVEVWEVVDKGRTKKKTPTGLKLENQSAPSLEENDAPVLDATFLDVYKNATGVILMLDITKPWTFEYVVKELSQVPADLPVVILGNHCDMQHHRQVHTHHIDQALHHAKQVRTAPVRYAESSMRNGFGLRLLHKFLSIPFLRLQRTSLLEQLQRNQKDMEEIETELDEFQNSEECQYNTFLDRLTNKRKQNTSQVEPRPNNEHSPSIVLGAGKPIIPPNVNPLLAQSLNPSIKQQVPEVKQTQYVHPDLLKAKQLVTMEMTPPRLSQQDSNPSTPSNANTSPAGTLDEFYAGALDSSFLEDLTPLSNVNQELNNDSESDDDYATNPKVTVDEDDLDIDSYAVELTQKVSLHHKDQNIMSVERITTSRERETEEFLNTSKPDVDLEMFESNSDMRLSLDNDYPLWSGDSSVRRSPEGGEDPDALKDPGEKTDKKHHKKKKSKDKDRGDYSEISERKDKKHKRKKSKSEKKPNPQQDLLSPSTPGDLDYGEYDSI